MTGSFMILIEGVGPHHSNPSTGDANQDHANLVDTLRAHGCSISSSVFRFGGTHAFSDENVLDTTSYRAQLAAEAGTTPTMPVNTAPVAPSSTAEPVDVDGGLVGETP